MSVELKDLYAEIYPQYDIKLHTKSCFGKMIDWVHTVEESDFVSLLHGNELVFNSGLNYTSDEWLVRFVKELDHAHAGGLIIALKEGKTLSEKAVDYCNRLQFPLFSASWRTPYIDIMRMFSVILLRNEQRDTNLIAALKNAIFYPDNEDSYLNHFERNGYFREMSYVVVILSCHAYDTDRGNEHLESIQKSLSYTLKSGIVYEEKGRLIVLIAGYQMKMVRQKVRQMCEEDANIFAGIGTVVQNVRDIHKSYDHAYTAYRLTKSPIHKNLLIYEELGIYKLLADVKDKTLCPAFVQETLGPLLDYDKDNQTEYTEILQAYFDNDCSILITSKALYCHKNTLTYKLNKIKEILGYDILSNENRAKIMISLYILKLGTGYF